MEQQLKGPTAGAVPDPKAGKQCRASTQCLCAVMARSGMCCALQSPVLLQTAVAAVTQA